MLSFILTGEFDYFARSVAQRNYQMKDGGFSTSSFNRSGRE